MRKRAWMLLLLVPLFALLHAATPVAAASLPDKPSGVNYADELSILSDSTKTQINKVNREWAGTKKQPQVGVAVVKSTDGEELSEYAPDLFAKWGIGNKDEDNGVLIVFAKNGGKNNMRIEVGYGLEDTLTDSTAADILNANLDDIKSTDDQDVNTAITNVFNAVAKQINHKYGYTSKQLTDSDDSQQRQGANQNRVFSGVIKIAFIVVIVIIILASAGGGGGGNGRRRRGGSSWWLWYLLGSLLGGGGRGPRGPYGGGGGGFGGGDGFGGGGGFGGGSDWGGGSSGGGGADV